MQQVQIYQVTDLQWISHPEKNRLLVTTYVDVAVSNWEIFHIRPAVVSEWISGRSPNLGLVIVVTSLQGHPADHHFFSHDPHTSKQPILVLFSTSKAADSSPPGQFHHSTGFWVECRPSGRNLSAKSARFTVYLKPSGRNCLTIKAFFSIFSSAVFLKSNSSSRRMFSLEISIRFTI